MGSVNSLQDNTIDDITPDSTDNNNNNNQDQNIILINQLKTQVNNLTDEITIKNTQINRLTSENELLKRELEENNSNVFTQSIKAELENAIAQKEIIQNQLDICLEEGQTTTDNALIIFKQFCIRHNLQEFENITSPLSIDLRNVIFSAVRRVYVRQKYNLFLESYTLTFNQVQSIVENFTDNEFLTYLISRFSLQTLYCYRHNIVIVIVVECVYH